MPTWKKVIVSGSQAHLAAVTASSAVFVGSNQAITSTANDTQLSGSFSGSFSGNVIGTAATASYVTGSIFSGTNLALSSSYALTASYALNVSVLQNLTGSGGITSFTYNGTGVAGVSLKNNANFTGNALMKWDSGNTQLTNSNITDDGTTVRIAGNLEIAGTTTTVSASNLVVADKFILLASGSTSNTDGGLVVQNAANATGSAFYWEGTDQRWSVNPAVGATDTVVAANSYMVTVSGSGANPSGNPLYGAADGSRIGAMYVNTTDESIWIWS